MTGSVDYADAVRHTLKAVLRDSAHYGGRVDGVGACVGAPQMIADNNGTQLAVCPCGAVVEIPGGIEQQMQARGFTVTR